MNLSPLANATRTILLLAALSGTALADISQAPPAFPFRDGNVVYVDFQRADYHLVYDFDAKSVTVETEITFNAPTDGYPLFDLIPEPRAVKLDGREVSVGMLADPDSASKFRVVEFNISAGRHQLTMTHTLSKNVDFREGGVASAFWMSDLDDRQYLEQYLPTNFEYDAYPMGMRLEVVNARGVPHVLRANGEVKTVSTNVFQVEFPAFYTTSSMFFHLAPASAFPTQTFDYKSVDGRMLPVVVYSRGDVGAFVSTTKKVLAELERDYGPFPHTQVIVYGAGSGGMEYSGATVSSVWALGHELFHSYNARAVMPAQGNAGWIDEAISSWRDKDYVRQNSPGGVTRMAGHSAWTRMTDTDAYSKGAAFLAWIAGRMHTSGKDFKLFLREYFRANFYHTVTTAQFEDAIERYSGLDLRADFDRYVYGKDGERTRGSVWKKGLTLEACGRRAVENRALELEHPFHPRLSEKQLRELL